MAQAHFIIEGRVISKKNSRILVGGRALSLPSKAYKRFSWDMLIQVKQQLSKNMRDIRFPLPPPYHIDLRFDLKGKLDIDIDNATTSIYDVLQDAGVITDDKFVLSATQVKKGGFPAFTTYIGVKTIV